jgi:hypothetical protein
MTDITRRPGGSPSSATSTRPESEAGWGAEGKSPAEIESDIEKTRERMTEDIDAIGEKLSPEHLKQRAREAVTDAKEAVVEKVQEATGEVGRKAKEMGSGLMDLVKENPLPAAVAGVSLYWLFSRRKNIGKQQRRSASNIGRYPYGSKSFEGEGFAGKMEGAKDKMQEWSSEAGEKVQELGAQAKRAGNKLETFFENSPLISAAGVMVLGAVIGASIPATEKENELMGTARDDLVDKVSEVASQAKDTIQDKMSESGQSQGRGQGQQSGQPGGQRSGSQDAGRSSSQSQRPQGQQMSGTGSQPGGAE